MKLLPRADVWRHPEGWAVSVYQPNNTVHQDLPLRVYKTVKQARRNARDLMLLNLVEEVWLFNCSRVRVAKLSTPEDI